MSARPKINQSALKSLRILEYLFEQGLTGSSLAEITSSTDVAHSTTWRLLHTLKSQGWVVDTPGESARQSIWRIADKPARLAFSFKRHTVAQIQGIENKFMAFTGESVRYGD